MAKIVKMDNPKASVCFRFVCYVLLTALGCDSGETEHVATGRGDRTAETAAFPVTVTSGTQGILEEAGVHIRQFPTPKPPLSPGVFPCTTCHSVLEDHYIKRKLTLAHTDIRLDHGPREKWCFECHNPNDRNKLRLSSGAAVAFDETHKLCGQCHGPKLRDWRSGAHGRRIGMWNGVKEYLLCVHCHNPHAPRFAPLAPKPAPDLPLVRTTLKSQ